jgi:hypothetical protein
MSHVNISNHLDFDPLGYDSAVLEVVAGVSDKLVVSIFNVP